MLLLVVTVISIGVQLSLWKIAEDRNVLKFLAIVSVLALMVLQLIG